MPKVSIIVPIYNVQSYIERCARSLFSQTLDELEYIFVNDCTPDSSITILNHVLQDYPHRKSQVKIINRIQNGGQAAARTDGMKTATGEYMIHCDPDDWVELDMYEAMYKTAKESNADVVICDAISHFTSHDEPMKWEDLYNSNDWLKHRMNIWWSLWNRLVRTSIIKENNIYPFSDINLTEDMNVMMRVYYYAKKFINIHKGLYHYNRMNEASALTNANSLEKYMQRLISAKEIDEFFKSKNFDAGVNWYQFKQEIRDCLFDYNAWDIWQQYFTDIKDAKGRNILYRIAYRLANMGWLLPLKLAIKIKN